MLSDGTRNARRIALGRSRFHHNLFFGPIVVRLLFAVCRHFLSAADSTRCSKKACRVYISTNRTLRENQDTATLIEPNLAKFLSQHFSAHSLAIHP